MPDLNMFRWHTPTSSLSTASRHRSEASVYANENALVETINGLYTAECLRTIFHDGPHRTIADVEYPTAGWVDWFNSRKPLSILDHVPPVEFENAHYATFNREQNPA